VQLLINAPINADIIIIALTKMIFVVLSSCIKLLRVFTWFMHEFLTAVIVEFVLVHCGESLLLQPQSEVELLYMT